jgi:protein TonB
MPEDTPEPLRPPFAGAFAATVVVHVAAVAAPAPPRGPARVARVRVLRAAAVAVPEPAVSFPSEEPADQPIEDATSAGVLDGSSEGVAGGEAGGLPGGTPGGCVGCSGDGPAGDYDLPPRMLKRVSPVYPPEAFVKKVEGVVLVEFWIDAQGEVRSPRVVRSVPMLDEAALTTVRQWRFAPALKNGRPVATMARAPVRFAIF